MRNTEPASKDQENFEKIELASMAVLYDDKTHPQIMQMLESQKDDPAKAIAGVTSLVITQLDEQSGWQIPEQLVLPSAEKIMDKVAELGELAGLFQVDDTVMQAAAQEVMTDLLGKYGVDQDAMNALQQQYGEQMPSQQPNQSRGIINQGMENG